MRDKEGPVCSVQHQTEPVASFVPQKPFHHKAHSSILLLLLFPHPLPNSLPTSKRTRLTSDLHSSSSMSFRIKHQVFSFLLLPSSYILFPFPLSHIPVQCCTWRGSFAPPSQHVNAQVVWFSAIAEVKPLTVYMQCALFRIKKNFMWHADPWGVTLGIDFNQPFDLWGTNKNHSIMPNMRGRITRWTSGVKTICPLKLLHS